MNHVMVCGWVKVYHLTHPPLSLCCVTEQTSTFTSIIVYQMILIRHFHIIQMPFGEIRLLLIACNVGLLQDFVQMDIKK